MRSITTRALHAPLWLHAVALFTVTLALLPLAHIDTVFFADEGSGLAQAQQLANGDGWQRPASFPAADPAGETFPLFNAQTADPVIPLGQHPVYALVVEPWFAVGGQAAAAVLSLVGLALAAFLSGRLADRLRPGLGVATLWVAGLASPLFFDGYLVVAHTLAASAAAGVALALVRVLRRERVVLMTVLGGVLIATAGLLRNEALLFGAAVGLVALALGARWHDPALVAFGVVAGVSSMTARALEALIRSRIASGGHAGAAFSTATESGSRLGQIVSGGFITLLLPSYGHFDASAVLLLLAVVSGVVSAVVARRRPDDRNGLFLFGGLAVVLLTVRLAFEARPVPGIVWACPVLVIGGALIDRPLLRSRSVRALVVVTIVFAGAVLATQYGAGGGREWGWRYFSLALPIAIAVAVIAIVDGAARIGRGDRRVAAVLLAGLCLATGALAFLASRATRDENREIVDAIRANYETTPAVDGGKPVVVTTQWGTIDRFSWDHVDETRWLVIAPTDRSKVAVYLDRIAKLGVGQVTFVTTNIDEDRPFVLAEGDVIAQRDLPADHHVLTVRLRL